MLGRIGQSQADCCAPPSNTGLGLRNLGLDCASIEGKVVLVELTSPGCGLLVCIALLREREREFGCSKLLGSITGITRYECPPAIYGGLMLAGSRSSQ